MVALRCLVYPWNHVPFPSHGVFPEFRPVPLPAGSGGDSQVYGDEAEAGQEGLVNQLSFGSGEESQGEVYRAFGRVVGTDDPSEYGVSGNGILLEREEEMVTVVLEAGRNEEEGDAEESAQRRRDGHFDIVKG